MSFDYSTPRVEELRARQKELNRKRKDYSLTNDEHIILKEVLIKIREGKKITWQ